MMRVLGMRIGGTVELESGEDVLETRDKMVYHLMSVVGSGRYS